MTADEHLAQFIICDMTQPLPQVRSIPLTNMVLTMMNNCFPKEIRDTVFQAIIALRKVPHAFLRAAQNQLKLACIKNRCFAAEIQMHVV